MNLINLLNSLHCNISSSSCTLDYLSLATAIKKLNVGTINTVTCFSNLPTASAHTGKLYYVSCDQTLYWSTGSAWQTLSSTRATSIFGWGCGASGQLGTGTGGVLLSPVSAVGGFTDWCCVSAGDSHSLGLRKNGSLWAWGLNTGGQLGDGTVVIKSSPVSVVGGFTDWCTMDVGGFHNIAIRQNGTLWAWGCGSNGRLGDNTAVAKSSPVSVVGGFTDWCQVSASYSHNLAVRCNGSMWAWGSGQYGQLGNNAATIRSSPVSIVGGFTDWCRASVGSCISLGVRQNGTLWAWGFGFYGQLGNNIRTIPWFIRSPISIVGGFNDWCQVSASMTHSAAVRTNGTVWAWGCNNCGQLGDNTLTAKSSPVSVVGGFTDWCQVSVGQCQSLAVRQNGSLWGWGWNGCGLLGDGTVTTRCSPVSVVGGFTDWCQVSAGQCHSLAVRCNGSLWAWGLGAAGRLGDNTVTNKSSPVSVVGGFTDWCQVSAGSYHSAAVRQNGSLWTWGCGSLGRLGDNTTVNKSSPISVVGGFTDWCHAAAGFNRGFGLRCGGTLWAWGDNAQGQLGDGTTTSRSSPVVVAGGFSDWCRVNVGPVQSTLEFVVAARSNCTIWGWGRNVNGGLIGSLGDGTYCFGRSSPVSVVGGIAWRSAAAGGFHSLGISTSGVLWGWGSNCCGQLAQGDQPIFNFSSPISVVGGFTDWCQASAGRHHSLGVRCNGTLWSWGRNQYGQLGTGLINDNTCNQSSPVSVIGGIANWCQASAGCTHSLGITTGGALWAWGYNNCGQLGNNSILTRCSPTCVVGGFTDWSQVSAGSCHTMAIKRSLL